MKINNLNLKNYIQWLKKRNLSAKTVEAYSKVISRRYGNQPFNNKNITAFIKKLAKEREAETCKSYRNALSSYAKWQKITNIDWESINNLIPKVQKKFFITINEEELVKLKEVRFEKNNFIYQRNSLIMDFLFYTGVRVSELVNIKHRDLWENNGLRILGKGNKIRYIFLPEFLIEHIKLGSIGYLFKNSKGSRISNRQVRKMICQRVKLAKLNKWISPHSFRRSFATLLDRKGARMSTIQKLLGHNDINTTLGYIHNNYEILYQDYSKLWKNEANISVS